MITFISMNDLTTLREARNRKIEFIRQNHPFYTWVNFVGYTDEEIDAIRQKTELFLKANAKAVK